MKKKILSLFIMVGLLVSYSPISATDITSATIENVNTVQELQEAIVNSSNGDTIKLSSSFVSGPVIINTQNKEITIDGSDVVWDTGNISINGNGRLTIKNIKVDGTNISGRLLKSSLTEGTLNLEDMEFYNASGGALDLNSPAGVQTTILRVKIFNNTAGAGPAVFLGSNTNLLINYSTIDNNVGTAGGYEGGAIASKNYAGKLEITNTVLSKNVNKGAFTGVIGGGGGAIFMNRFYGTLKINESYFKENSTNGADGTVAKTYDGGAIYILYGSGGSTVDINNSTFDGNIAYDDGGAIMIQGNETPGITTTIRNSTFYGNKAYGLDGADVTGGAIQFFQDGGSTDMENVIINSTFVENQAGNDKSTVNQKGGAVSTSGSGWGALMVSVDLSNSLFIGNTVYGSDGEVNEASNYKDVSYSSSLISSNLINIDKGLSPQANKNDVIGKNNAGLSTNFSGIVAGVDKLVVPTIPLKPDGLAENKTISKIDGQDQRGLIRYKDFGAIETTWIKYDSNEGKFNLPPQTSYSGGIYYENDEEGLIDNYFNLGYVGRNDTIESGVSLNITREGYIFTGWSEDRNAITPDSKFGPGNEYTHTGENKVLYAVWEKVQTEFSVTYKDGLNGTIFADQTNSDIPRNTVTPEFMGSTDREGYTFKGWNPALEPTVTRDAVYTAEWEINKYTVTYESNGGTPVQPETVNYNKVFTQPTNPVKDGNIFKGWYSDEALTQAYDFSTPASKDITLYAKWEEEVIPVKEFTITYTDGVNGTVFADESIVAKEGEATPAYSKEILRYGYIFEGWSPEVAATVTEDVTYVAQWKAIDIFTVTYTDGVDGEEIFKDQVTNVYRNDPSPQFEGNEPTREGYIFKGWSPEYVGVVTDNITYTAQWEKIVEPVKEYMVTYTDGTENESLFKDQVSVIKEGDVTPAFNGIPTREGYTFEGWSPEVTTTVTQNVTYVAQWKEIEEPIKPVDPTNPVKPVEPALPPTGVSNNHIGLLISLLGSLLVGLRLIVDKKKKLYK
ncbi:hypothetical protein G7059_03960 [Erysipelothrix sp. HDW6A]|uniref:InlB B-repeat-containing protein n=1 Tax=Erysipelothrix sp. HDW6A TaxID=2714928 RepID=UPI001407EE9E|nr:InlB B-repeat-containing protein [Erysipelothrix sp. HDW6A]QIK57060.1 hypothetical protein G7059_03960 [Erysipelothrix sp. HDW6A]